jgi:hypothetical protein
VNPIFLNLMGTMASRSGRVLVRVGGNSQERATLIPEGLPKGKAINKTELVSPSRALVPHPRLTCVQNGFTPTVNVAPGLIYAMANISNFVNVDWFIGLPFNDINNPRYVCPCFVLQTLTYLKTHSCGTQSESSGLATCGNAVG